VQASRGILGDRATNFYLAFWIAFAIDVRSLYQALVGLRPFQTAMP
jgi:hypothetical protein